jgi:EpsI family protein
MTRLETPNAAIEVATESLAGRAHGLVAHRWYWIDGIATSSGLRARLAQLRQRLRGSAPRGYWVAIASSGEGAERTLAEFMRENGVHIDRWLAEDAARAR